MNFKFVIHNSRIYFGKRPVKLVPSKNKQFPASKGYFTFTIKGWTYYILFAPTGIKVTARRGRKIVRTFVTRKIKKIIKPVKKASSKQFILHVLIPNQSLPNLCPSHLLLQNYRAIRWGKKRDKISIRNFFILQMVDAKARTILFDHQTVYERDVSWLDFLELWLNILDMYRLKVS